MRWLLPGYLLLVGLLPVAWWPRDLLLAWQTGAWPALFSFWQAVQLALPFPVTAVLLPVMLLGLIGLPLLLWLRAGRPVDAAFAFTLAGTLLLCWLQLGWAPNYLRPTVASQLLRDVQPDAQPTVGQRLELARYLLAVINDNASVPAHVAGATWAASRELDGLLGPLGYPGPVLSGPERLPAGLFMAFGVAGSLFPPTLEAFVDSGLPDWQQVAVGVHELAHVTGVAGEDDATLLAALAGLRSGHGYARYALALDAVTRLDLPATDRQDLLGRLGARAQADLTAAKDADDHHRLAALSAAQDALFGFWLSLQGGNQSLGDYSLGASRLPLALEAGLLP